MKKRRTYITPATRCLSLKTGRLMQDAVIFSGGAPDENIIIDEGGDGGEGTNRIIRWKNRIWGD